MSMTNGEKSLEYTDNLFIWSNTSNFDIAFKVARYRDFSGPYFPVFGPEKTPYLDTFTQCEGWGLTLVAYKSVLRLFR